MGIARARALKRIAGLTQQITEHLAKMNTEPESRHYNHWRAEASTMVTEVERLARHVGRRSGAEVLNRVAQWKSSLAERDD